MRHPLLYGVLFLFILSCSTPPIKSKLADRQAPDLFRAKFETTKGEFLVEFHRELSPLAVDRAFQLISTGFYTNSPIFRVVKEYVAQFGINNDSTINSYWSAKRLIDEPVVAPNSQATVSFARGGPNSRGTQLFINLKNNSPRLDTLNYSGVSGFPAIGKLIEGAAVIDTFYSGYGNDPSQDSIQVYGNKYLVKNFPELDYIQKVIVIK